MSLSISEINLIVVAVGGFYLLGLITVINALLYVRTPQGTTAWVIALISIPFLAVPLYWLIGRRRFVGYVRAKMRSDEHLRGRVQIQGVQVPQSDPAAASRHRMVAALESFARIPPVGDNAVDLLVDGEAYFSSALQGLAKARHYVLVQYYIIADDQLGQQLSQVLIQLARRGVRVCLMYDVIGSHALSRRYRQQLTAAGVQLAAFRSTRGPGTPLQINFRNHRKIVVVDGEAAWLGGHNFADEYLNGLPALGAWRDTSMKIQGPAVLGLQHCFAEDWYWATGQTEQLNWTPHIVSEYPANTEDGMQGPANAQVLIVPTGPADELDSGALMFQQAIQSAEHRIWIASPYFVPDTALINALQLAALRGVEVKILIPSEADHRVVYWAGFAFAQDLSGLNIGIFRYQNGFMHQKVMLIDEQVAAVGTANLDNRSMRLNFEVTAFVMERRFVNQVEQMLRVDFAQAILDPDDVFDRLPAWKRLRSRAAYLAAPLL